MPIRVRYKNESENDCCIRPTPFIAISSNNLKNKEGNFGVTYSITLTGTLLPAHGSPYAIDPATGDVFPAMAGVTTDGWEAGKGPEGAFAEGQFSQGITNKPAKQDITGGSLVNGQLLPKYAAAILSKQRVLRALFARDGQRVELSDVMDNAGATIVCYPRVISVDFEGDQAYTTQAKYTIVLEADYLLRGNFNDESLIVDDAATLANTGEVTSNKISPTAKDFLEDEYTHFIETYSEDWALEVDDAVAESVENPRTYRISHNLSATGKAVYGDSAIKRPADPEPSYDPNTPAINLYKPAWMQARDFVQSKLASNPSGSYPNVMGQIGSGTVNLVGGYGGFNHVRTENINVGDGTYSISENWILASGTATENYSASTSTSNSDPFVNVSIEGSIKGLNTTPPDAYGDPNFANSGAYPNARNKYNQVTNSGQFGLTSDVYKRANNLVAVQLNSQPVSLSVSTNQFNGDISYSLAFNNRPTNIVSGVIAESIQVNDTYPGDVFATIPVLGRATGPILQYIGGRTEYKRDVSINLTMDYTKIPYGNTRNSLILKKPSIVEPTATQIAELLGELSPAGEPGVRKYFISAPTESWSPKEGTYSFNISWTYEIDR